MNLTCIEPETAARCKPIVDSCHARGNKDFTVEQCQIALSSATPSGQKGMIGCMQEGCGVNEFAQSCLPIKLGR